MSNKLHNFVNMSNNFAVDNNGMLHCFILMEYDMDETREDGVVSEWSPCYFSIADVLYISNNLNSRGEVSLKSTLVSLISGQTLTLRGNAKELAMIYSNFLSGRDKFKFN
jgi:hypothetical protein